MKIKEIKVQKTQIIQIKEYQLYKKELIIINIIMNFIK